MSTLNEYLSILEYDLVGVMLFMIEFKLKSTKLDLMWSERDAWDSILSISADGVIACASRYQMVLNHTVQL